MAGSLALIVVLIIVTIAIAGSVVKIPPSPVPGLSLFVNGQVTNAAGVRFNVLSITNTSPTTVFAYMPRMLIKGNPAPVANAGAESLVATAQTADTVSALGWLLPVTAILGILTIVLALLWLRSRRTAENG